MSIAKGLALSKENEAQEFARKGLNVSGARTSVSRLAIVPIVIVSALMIGAGIGIWQLRPKQLPQGRPLGEARKVQAFAIPAIPTGEGYSVWKHGRKVFDFLPRGDTSFERVELSSDDIDIAGGSDPDLVLYTWSGGTHCCFTQVLIDGRTGRRLGDLQLGNGDPTPFLATKAKGLARAVAINVDDVSAFKFGSYADSPMARILVVWDGHRFGLDIKRMKAALPDSPPSFFISEPELGETASIGVVDVGTDEENPGASTHTGNARGDRAKTYQSWMESEETRMRETALDPADLSSYGPMAAFLNERIYKGQGVAGVATVLDAFNAEPDKARAALVYYFSIVGQSRWLGDLDKLNDGALLGLIGRFGASSAGAPK